MERLQNLIGELLVSKALDFRVYPPCYLPKETYKSEGSFSVALQKRPTSYHCARTLLVVVIVRLSSSPTLSTSSLGSWTILPVIRWYSSISFSGAHQKRPLGEGKDTIFCAYTQRVYLWCKIPIGKIA